MRFGYDGSGFYGWARQPAKITVEGTIRSALRSRGIAANGEAARLGVASRTDRGVSARANVMALSSTLGGASLLDRLNSISPVLLFTATAEVPLEFRVRSASRRIYRYFDPTPASQPGIWETASRLFRGQIDVRSFGRGLAAQSPVWRTIDRVDVVPSGSGRRIEVAAPSFVWGMVRKIVGALREVDAGRLALARLRLALAGGERLTLPMAEPEGLVLWDVHYPDVGWTRVWSGPNRHQQRYYRDRVELLWQRSATLGALLGDGTPSSKLLPGPG